MTKIFESVSKWRKFRQKKLFDYKKIGFVPTMGNLHLGHESLLKRSIAENEMTVLTIFVNPTQFNDAKDLVNYPRTLEADIHLAETLGVNFVFIPEYKDIYPDDYRYKIVEQMLSTRLCGKFRPGHFEGMLTVVFKLLMLIMPSCAYFGEKDYQQLQLIKNMVSAFFINVEIRACPIVRDENGLALSSRNKFLNPSDLALAPLFPKILNSNKSLEEIKNTLSQCGFVVEYVEEYANKRLAAVRLGDVRLIDNVPISNRGENNVNNNA